MEIWKYKIWKLNIKVGNVRIQVCKWLLEKKGAKKKKHETIVSKYKI